MERNFLTQIVRTPTREGNILDLVLTNVPRYIKEVEVTPTPLSDHDMVKLQLGFNLTKPDCTVSASPDPFFFRAVNYHNADF